MNIRKRKTERTVPYKTGDVSKNSKVLSKKRCPNRVDKLILNGKRK